jgi:hypothetical protein
MKYAVYNDSNHVFSAADMEFAQVVNPAGISTWDGDFSAFRERGGKIISYHGRSDAVRSQVYIRHALTHNSPLFFFPPPEDDPIRQLQAIL